jgi:AcrR family transcriptional regulator
MLSMADATGVKPNRRGVKSRELVLDAAERVMARDGFEAATVARVVEEAGIPMSSVYHYFGSKDGILLAVMERGAERFFADLPDADERVGEPIEHLEVLIAQTVTTLELHPNFLRLLIGFAAQPPSDGDVHAVVGRVREMALTRLRKQIAIATGRNPRTREVDDLARFALAAVDGAFVASQTDSGVTLARILAPLPAALVA